MRNRLLVGGVLAVGLAILGLMQLSAQAPSLPELRKIAMKNMQSGNFKDAYEGLRKVTLDPACEKDQVGKDLDSALMCLQRLGRTSEIDEYREAVIAVHADNWRLLAAAANTQLRYETYGFIVAGKFYRGGHRGGGHFVNTYPRDRVRALQLYQDALGKTAKENDKVALAQFFYQFAQAVNNQSAWHLQYLSNLTKLPDYEDGNLYTQGHTGAPVGADGKPIYYQVPKSYETAASDGERWRWLLSQVVEFNPGRISEIDLVLAHFYRGQFGVQTMAYLGIPQNDEKSDTGTFALNSLKDDETIARLATGVKRFTLPEEFNWIKIFERVAARGKTNYGQQALENLAQEYEDRRQYPKAAEVWKKCIQDYGAGNDNYRQKRLDQIIGNWARFEPTRVQSTGKAPSIDVRYRNGNKISFEAFALNVELLLDDVKKYLESNPGRIDWQNVQIGDIGHRVVERNQQKYLGAKVATWELNLKPRPEHFDSRVTTQAPLDKAGAYLVTAKMADGNESRIIVWVADTAIAKKQLDGQIYYFIADADTGVPIDGASVEFFGYTQEQVAPNKNQFRTVTRKFNETADKDGQLFLRNEKQEGNRFQWLVTARRTKAANETGDRFAYLGFTNIWYNRIHDPEYNQTKVLFVTDRPVYRPDQPVQWKTWVAHAKYDQGDVSVFAGQNFKVQIFDPKGEKVFEKSVTADEFGGMSGEFHLPRGTTLGMYRLHVPTLLNNFIEGGNTFRVEEYKKPEFEVTVEAPKEPVMLGEKFEASIQAKYYFGAPVTSATVKFKVLRTNHTTRWYPSAAWDWFYGSGYWWFSPDNDWYPGFNAWGCRRPIAWWFHNPQMPPEVVLESESPIGPDGKVVFEIDTTLAKELHGNQDHSYQITAEVVDQSRRTITGSGQVLVARKPFQVTTWLNRGFYQAGDVVKASFKAQRIDRKPVQGEGDLTLYAISYKDGKPVETAVQNWKVNTNEQGDASQQLTAAKAGQYRLSYKVTDTKGHTIEGAQLFIVRGTGFDGKDFRFNDLELVTDRKEYAPGEEVQLMVNTNRVGGTVLLFTRPSNGVYLPPKVIRLEGKSTQEKIEVLQKDMPNFFIEAMTIADARIYTEQREVIVPPEKRVLNVDIVASQSEYKPGQEAKVKVKLTDFHGNPFVGQTVLSVYDRSVEYISGGTNVPEIREFFWKWRRQHRSQTQSNLMAYHHNLLKSRELGMNNLGVFGETAADEFGAVDSDKRREFRLGAAAPGAGFGGGMAKARQADGQNMNGYALTDAKGEMEQDRLARDDSGIGKGNEGGEKNPLVEPTIRKNFADTAFWNASVITDKDGLAEVSFKMPENLTAWKIRVWALGKGTKVGQSETVVTTKKDLIVRLQAPRFFTQKDEVVLSANVHNYHKADKKVRVTLELEGGTLGFLGNRVTEVTIPAGGEQRVDWRVKVQNEGEAIIRMKAQTDDDADAMEMRFPCFVHGMLKMESWTGVIRPSQEQGGTSLNVPAERRIAESRLEVRYSPTLAGALVDALPYLVDYPYGCTEQTLNRFLPTVITQRILQKMKIDLAEVAKHQTNLNSQEIGNDKERIAQWKRYKINPVFDEAEVVRMTQAGVNALAGMQISDGGWGWFSGFGERSFPHTTATVVHGLQLAKANDVALPAGMLERGQAWLKSYQDEQVRRLQNYPTRTLPWKQYADNIDALVYMVLVDANVVNNEMRDFLYRDRNQIAVYAKAMFGLALHKQQAAEQLKMILDNIRQYVVEDEENQTAYLRMPESNNWWYWYGNEIEANAYYLKLLAATNAQDTKAAGLVKYLLNNRKHATYWNSTRDTAICIEAFADYLKASGEDSPEMTVEVWLDGQKRKEVQINKSNLFTFDNKLVLVGDQVTGGKHSLEIKRKGSGPVYWNAYLTNFTLEDFITKAGLEVRVDRRYYKLTRVDEKIKVSGSRGQALDQAVVKYERTPLDNLATLKSGDLVEVELEIDSKNDYEYLIFEDPKAAGFEPVQVRSGYNSNSLGAYMELRDEKVCFFVRNLARGKHSVSYRMRAEIPGTFSALPTRGYAMYAPELKGNSDEIKLSIQD